MKNTRISLREIAEKTGVTRMSVSLALRGKGGVSAETRERVFQTAAKLGYEPDPEIAKLLSHIRKKAPSKTKACIALLTSGATADDWKNSATETKYVEGARERAKEYGYRIDDFWINDPDMTVARLGKVIWNRGIEGVIIAPLQGELWDKESRSIHLDFSLFPAVEISETVEWPDLERSIHDQYTSMLKVLEELTKLNYRSIGLVLEESLDLRVNGKWTAAYLYHRNRQGVTSTPPPLILGTQDQKSFDKWFNRYQPDVIVSVNQFGLRLMKDRGLNVPRDIGYASLDVDGDALHHPSVSGINQNSRLVGAAAVDMLVAAVQRGQRGLPKLPFRTEIEGSWIQGATTPRRRKSA
jgi:LacI family transcriptional regulator